MTRSVAAARLKSLLAKIREELRQTLDPSRLQAAEADKELFRIKVGGDDIEAAAIYLCDLGLSADALRLRKSFEQCRCREVGELLAEMADGKPGEERDRWTELFGSFPDSVAHDDQSVSDRRMMLIGLVAQLQKFVDELIGTVEGLLSFNGETPPPCSNGSPAATRRRGAKEKAETRELAEFAKPHVAKGLGWGEIRDLFIKDHPTKARKYADVPEGHEWEADHKRKLADKIKNAYFSKYPAT